LKSVQDLAPLPQVGLLSEVLAMHAENQPHALAYVFLEEGKNPQELSFQQLDYAARRIAMQLNLSNGSSNVLLLFPQGLEFVKAFLGCVYAGLPAVPLSMPRAKQSLDILERVALNCDAKIVLCTSTTLALLNFRIEENSVLRHLKWIAVDQLSIFQENLYSVLDRQCKSTSPLFLQYTSGSTGSPKGVVISNHNLLHNINYLASTLKHTRDSVIVSWLPHFHDMGLIGAILQALYVGIPCVLLSPTAFVQKPYLWLKAINDYKGTIGGGPNFAYDLCVSKITEEQAASLDLSSWKIAWTGAELVREKTLIAFENRFCTSGFAKTTFMPVYGMAECTLAVTTNHFLSRFKKVDTDLTHLSKNQIQNSAINLTIDTKTIVSCGHGLPDQEIRIVSATDYLRLPELYIGEIYVKGPSVAQGYWNNSLATKENFNQSVEQENGFFKTGDLGFQYQGELYLVGRVKETMKINGRNIYPSDIEAAVWGAHSNLKPNGVAAFSIPADTKEKLVVVCELKRENLLNFDTKAIQKAVFQAIFDEYGIAIHDFLLIKTTTLPVTTSGKIQRILCKKLYIDKKLEPIYSARRQ
jgi:acyl-CoA synthetase (AMP-forming)/AMP-acid ligase II